jgi:hypothetical protein
MRTKPEQITAGPDVAAHVVTIAADANADVL